MKYLIFSALLSLVPFRGAIGQVLSQLPEPPRQKRPAWLREEGVVIAGAWVTRAYGLRAGGAQTYDQKMAAWAREHSEETARRLKALGFNLIMIPLYQGFGLQTEREAMEEAKRFTGICHRLGLRVGCYLFSGTIGYETMQAEHPDANEWLIRDQGGKYSHYDVKYYRRWANRDHPALRAHLREVVRYAVQEAKVDLVHMDNYHVGPGYEPFSVNQFRAYLKKKYSPEERTRRFGFTVMDFIEPPPPPPQPDRYNIEPLYQDFVDYRCETLTDTYRELAEYARSLNPDIVMEINPHGYYGRLNSHALPIGAVDHTQMLPWGGAFWDEGYPSRLENGRMITRFRSHKLGRQFDNTVFQYTPDRVPMAEAMANNLQSLGCPAWFAGGEITPMVSMKRSREMDPAVLRYIRFFHEHQSYYRDAEEVADIGVLNTYANTAYGPQVTRHRMAAFEQALYQSKFPFSLVPGRYPGNLNRFRVLVLADLALISDGLVDAVRDYVKRGGGLVITGQATQYDEHHYRREQPGLADLFPEPMGDKPLRAQPGKGRAVYAPKIEIPDKFEEGMLPGNRSELLNDVRWAAGQPLQVEVKAPETVTMSLYRQNGRRVLHLVNYDEEHPVSDIEVLLQLPPETTVASVTLLSPDVESPKKISAEQKGRQLRFTVPRLEVYALVSIEQGTGSPAAREAGNHSREAKIP